MGLILQSEELGFQYGPAGRPVFSGLNLAMREGSICCVLGPNGTGKSTLMKCCAGLLRPTAGRVLVAGQDLAALSDKRRAQLLACVPQSHRGVFAFTVEDVVLMGRAPHLGLLARPDRKDRRLAASALERLGIGHLARKLYTEISGGERQLVLFARVLTQQPRLLLLDEPTSYLDLGNVVQVLSLGRLLADSGMSIFMSTHFPDHAFLLADQVLVMKGGQLLGMGAATKTLSESLLARAYDTPVRLAAVPDYGTTCVPCHPLRQGGEFQKLAQPDSGRQSAPAR